MSDNCPSVLIYPTQLVTMFHGQNMVDYVWNMIDYGLTPLPNWIIVKKWSTMFRPWLKHGQGTWSTMFQTSTLNGHHCQNMVETRSSAYVLTMFWPWSKHALLTMFWPWSELTMVNHGQNWLWSTMVRIDYGQPWFDRGGHLTLMFKTWSNMVRYAIGFEFDHGPTMFVPWLTMSNLTMFGPCSIWHIVWSFLIININLNWIDKYIITELHISFKAKK